MLPCHRQSQNVQMQPARIGPKGRLILAIALGSLALFGAAFCWHTSRAVLTHFFSKTLPEAYQNKQTVNATLGLGLPLLAVACLFATHKWEKEAEEEIPLSIEEKRKTAVRDHKQKIIDAYNNPEKMKELSTNQLFNLYFLFSEKGRVEEAWAVYRQIESLELLTLKDAKLEYLLAYTATKPHLTAPLLHHKYNAQYLCELYEHPPEGLTRRSIWFALCMKEVDELAWLDKKFIDILPNEGQYEGLRERVLYKKSRHRDIPGLS